MVLEESSQRTLSHSCCFLTHLEIYEINFNKFGNTEDIQDWLKQNEAPLAYRKHSTDFPSNFMLAGLKLTSYKARGRIKQN